jgi:hypothetical protein
MRIATLLLFSVFVAPLAYGQETAKISGKAADPAVQELLEKIKEMQPPDLTYSDLASESDVIVVAKAISKAEIEWNDVIGGEFGKGNTKLLANRLRVLSVLKGESGDEIDVMTLEWNSNVIVLTNSDFAELRSKLLRPVVVPVIEDGEIFDFAKVVSGNHTYTIEPEYLLYLRRIEGNKFVPVSGQRYSRQSVRRINN